MMDNPTGILPFVFLPLILWKRKTMISKRHIMVILCFGAYFLLLSAVIFTTVFPYPRHFLPAIALACALSGIGMSVIHGPLGKRFLAGFVCLTAIAGGFYYGGFPKGKRSIDRFSQQIKYLVGQSSREDYLSEVLFNNGVHMNHELIKYVQTMPDSTIIMTLDYGNAYYVPRKLIKASYVYQILDVNALLAQLISDNVSHIYYSRERMDAIVANFYNGRECVLLDYRDKGLLTLEHTSDGQFLYRINYGLQLD